MEGFNNVRGIHDFNNVTTVIEKLLHTIEITFPYITLRDTATMPDKTAKRLSARLQGLALHTPF